MGGLPAREEPQHQARVQDGGFRIEVGGRLLKHLSRGRKAQLRCIIELNPESPFNCSMLCMDRKVRTARCEESGSENGRLEAVHLHGNL